MNVLVIGLGSMGKRRIRILKKYFSTDVIVGVDNKSERTEYCKEEYGILAYSSLEEALEKYNFHGAFVCTSPLSHNNLINLCLQKDMHVFTELNLVTDGYQENTELAKSKNKVLFLSSTAMYRKEMQYITDKVIGSNETIHYTYHVGQYLPDWHPWEKVNDYFISNSKTNGCRELLAIELPWIIHAFGKVKEMKIMSKKITNLDIDYKDTYSILLEHENGSNGVIVVDVVCREATRSFLAYGEHLYLNWNGTPDSLYQKNIESGKLEQLNLYTDIDKLDGYSKNIIENHYVDEVKEFFDVIDGKADMRYGFEEDTYTLNLIEEIEKA